VFADCFVIIAAMSIQCYLHWHMPHWLPQSFTLGEAAIIAQAAATFLLRASHFYVSAVSVLRICCTVDVVIVL